MTKNGSKHGQLTAWTKEAGISPTYGFELELGRKTPPLETAARIYHRTGKKFGALVNANPRDCQAVVRVLKQAGQLAA